MANASVSSVSQTDSASTKSDYRKRVALGNSLGQSQSVQSILFDTLFTSQFFESTLTQTSGEPNTSLSASAPLQLESKDPVGQHPDNEPNSVKDETTPEGSQEVVEENAAASMIALAFQPVAEPVQEVVDSADIEPICVVKCYAPQDYKTTETSTTDIPTASELSSNQAANEEASALPIETDHVALSANVSPEVQVEVSSKSEVGKSDTVSRQRNKKDDRNGKESVPIQSKDGVERAAEGNLQLKRQESQEVAPTYEYNSDNRSPDTIEVESQVEIAKHPEQAVQALNRRAERLAENKHGEASEERESTAGALDELAEPASIYAAQDREAIIDAALQTQPNVNETKLDFMLQSTQVASSPASSITTTTPAVAQPIPSSAASNGIKPLDAFSSNAVAAAAPKSNLSFTPSTPNVGVPGALSTQPPATKSGAATGVQTSYQRLDPSADHESLTAYQQTRLLQRVLKGLERFGDGSSTVRLRLHPPELGALEMSLQMKQQQLSATVIVDSESVQQVLQDNLQQLQSKLTEQGITIEKFEFRVQTTQESNAASDNSQQFSGSDGQAGTDRESRQGREFGEARSNWLPSQVGNNNESVMVDVGSNSGQRWIAASNINIHA